MRHALPTALLATVLLLSVSLASDVARADEKPEHAVAYRQGIMVAMAWNIGPLGKMIKGDIALDDTRFAFLAARAASLAPMALEGFTPDTAQTKSRAKASLWQHQDDFKKRMEDLTSTSAELAKVAAAGDHRQMRLLFSDTVKICKACHDEYQLKH